jgi:hypothetical protein
MAGSEPRGIRHDLPMRDRRDALRHFSSVDNAERNALPDGMTDMSAE